MSTKERLTSAAAYAKQGEPRKARAVLRDVDDPRADKLKKKIDLHYPRRVQYLFGVLLGAGSMMLFAIAVFSLLAGEVVVLAIILPLVYISNRAGRYLRE